MAARPRTPRAAPAPGGAKVAGAYGVALAAVLFLFLSYRVYSRHATFSHREFFWTGNVHVDAPMGFRLRADARGLAVLKHGLHDAARRIPLRTDGHGFRVPLASPATPAGSTAGIAAVGCSCTYAHGVPAESSYVALAGGLLGVPAHNLGVCGYSAVTSLQLLRDEIAALRPRAAVYGFGNFHLERSGNARADADLYQARALCPDGRCHIEPPAFDNRLVFATAPRIEALYYEPRLAGQPTPLGPARIRALLPLAWQDLARGVHPASLRLRFERPALPESAFCQFLLQEFLDLCRQHGATFVLLWFPAAFGERPAPGLLAAADALAGQADFVFVDVSPVLFAAAHDQDEYAARWQVPRDGHPNRFMHLEMARALAAALAPRGIGATPPAAASR